MQTAMGRDDAAFLKAAYGAQGTVTAGGAGDATAINSASLDLRDGFGVTRYGTLVAVVEATATLAATKTLVVTGKWQGCDDNATWVDVAAAATILTLTDSGAGSTQTGATLIGCDSKLVGRYARFVATPDLNATGTDTAKVAISYVLSHPSVI